jgi:branched-chain amino acid transport system substrate-binding protein
MVASNVKKLGIKQPLIMSHGIANMEFINLAKSAADDVIFPAGKLLVAYVISSKDPQKRVIGKYIADYEKAYGKTPNTFAGHAWDSFMLVIKALEEVGPDRAKMQKSIENTKRFAGISGVFNFRPNEHNGLNHNAFALLTIKNGKWAIAK